MQSVCYRRPPPPLQPSCVCHDVLSASSLRPSIHHTNLVTMVMQEAHIAKVVAMVRVIEAEKTLQAQGVVESASKGTNRRKSKRQKAEQVTIMIRQSHSHS